MNGEPSAASNGPCEKGCDNGNGNPLPPEPEGTVPGPPGGPESPGGAPDATRIPTRPGVNASTDCVVGLTLITPETGEIPDGGCQGCCELVPEAVCAGFGAITPGKDSGV